MKLNTVKLEGRHLSWIQRATEISKRDWLSRTFWDLSLASLCIFQIWIINQDYIGDSFDAYLAAFTDGEANLDANTWAGFETYRQLVCFAENGMRAEPNNKNIKQTSLHEDCLREI